MTQLDFESYAYNGKAPSVAGSDTSEAAADSVQSASGRLRAVVFAHVKRCGAGGATCDEVEAALEMRHQTASARVRELVLGGHLRDSGQRRQTRSGRNAAVWVAQ